MVHSKLETRKELKFESESETETCLTMYNETESETILRSRDSQFQVRDERLEKFCSIICPNFFNKVQLCVLY